MGAERIVMAIHFHRRWNTPTVTSNSVFDVTAAEFLNIERHDPESGDRLREGWPIYEFKWCHHQPLASASQQDLQILAGNVRCKFEP